MDKIDFKRLRALARYKIKEAKRSSWKTYVSTLNKDTTMKAVWKRYRKIDGKYTNQKQTIIEDNNVIIIDPKLVANKIAQSLAEISSTGRYQPEFLRYKVTEENINIDFRENITSDYNREFTLKNYNVSSTIIKTLSKGPDGIHYSLVKYLSNVLLLLLLNI